LLKASAELNSELSFFVLSKGGIFLRTTYATRAQLGHVLAALMPENRLVMQLCIATGLRVSDVLELRTSELKRRQTVRQKKTGKTRRVQWPAVLYEQMEQGAGRLWVFESRTDPRRHRTRQAVWKDVKRAEGVFKRSGALSRRQNLGPHTARKVAAVEAYHRGGLPAAQRLLSHSDPLVTRLYALADLEVS
jgi:integrase